MVRYISRQKGQTTRIAEHYFDAARVNKHQQTDRILAFELAMEKGMP
jgi:quinol monooxygenase YgiN